MNALPSPVTTYVHTGILEAFREDLLNNTLVLLLNYTWRSGKYSERTLSHARIWGLASLKESCQQFRPALVFTVSATAPFVRVMHSRPRTIICVLPRDLRDGITNLVPHMADLFRGKTLEYLLSYRDSSLVTQREEEVP